MSLPHDSRSWLCVSCAREYASEPMRCECGGYEYTEITVWSKASSLYVTIAERKVDLRPRLVTVER